MKPEYRFFDSIDSTNNEIKRILASEDGVSEGIVVSAGTQTAGRGRSGRVWRSPEGESIATSMLLNPCVSEDTINCITIIAAMAVCDAVSALYPIDPEIKWPNDVLINRKKICGILCERMMPFVIVGIGINAHQKSFDGEIADIATSLDIESGMRCSRRAVTEALWSSFLVYYDGLLKAGNLEPYIDKYESLMIHRNGMVRINDGGTWDCKCLGLTPYGGMRYERNGKEGVLNTGEVSVRGVDGYV